LRANRRLTAAILLLTSIVWCLGTVGAAIHFHGVPHAVDEATGQVVHLQHQCRHHHAHHDESAASDDASPRVRQEQSGRHRGVDACQQLPAAYHASSLAAAGATVVRARARTTTASHSSEAAAFRGIALLSLAPKLSPPSTG